MSDEVSQFLEQVERLRGQQMEDDEVRSRELEEFLAAKRERQARREAGNSARLAKTRRLTSIERARFISPQKSSPVNTPSPGHHRRSVHLSEHAKIESSMVIPEKAFEPAAEPGLRTVPGSPTKENETPLDSTEAKRCSVAATPTRSSPLPWQRRPDSRSGGRPLSIVAAQNATQRSLTSTHEPSSVTEQVFPTDHSAQSMAPKDLLFVGQTTDRGVSSNAYRRSQAEDDRPGMTSVEAQQPGMKTEAPKQRPLSLSGAISPTKSRLGSPLSLRPRPTETSGDDTAPADQAHTTPSGKASPLRSASPTKGIGGFVQSAMMKRSDSVKRWSVTSPPGLTRADSVAASRSALDIPSSQAGSRPHSLIYSGSPVAVLSRPTSKHGEEPDRGATPRSARGGDLTVDTDCAASKQDDDAALASSPTKTMDSRRWSPTKSSWLESALNKPESPKLPPKPTQSQPAWMVELNKARAERANSVGTEATRQTSVTHKHQVSIGGLMRQSTAGDAVKPNPTGLGGIYSPPPATGRSALGHQPKASGGGKEMTMVGDKNVTLPDKRRPSNTSPTPTKAKPDTPPSRDFRASLRQRSITQDDNKPEEPEFKNVFGNLRRTKMQNYVAIDELKDNILRGKAALNVTDGPRKGERKDKFKEAIVKKREDFRKTQAEGKGITRGSISLINGTEKPVSEGTARRIEPSQPASRIKEEHTARAGASDEPQEPSPEPASRQSLSGSRPTTSSSPSPCSQQGPSTSDEAHAAVKAEQKGEWTASPKARLHDTESGGGGKLTGRFNSALAGMLTRGPPMATNGSPGSDGPRPEQSSSTGTVAKPTIPGPQLTHMTKNRARGPRRKAPTKSRAVPASSHVHDPAPAQDEELVAVKEAQEESAARASGRQDDGKELTGEGAKEDESEKPAQLSMPQHVAAQAAFGKHSREWSSRVESPVSATNATDAGIGEGSQPGSPKKLDMKRIFRFLDDAPASSAQARSSKEASGFAQARAGSRSPTKPMVEQALPGAPTSPGESDRDALSSLKSPALRSSRPGSPLKSPSYIPGGPQGSGGAAEAVSPRRNARGPVRPLSGVSGVSGEGAMSPVRSPMRQTSDVSTLLANFFCPPCPRQEARIDTAGMLANRPATGAKTTSLGVQMFQMLGDGTKKPVSVQNERVLFEQEMYVCAHNFINAAGRKLFELYFWVGDEVAEAAAEEAKLSVQREARSLGGTLVRLRQGQETAEFLQALGGVLLVRRGSSNKYDSLAPSMLCGRRYRGQVAFDEVDFAASSLCAGFSYLIAQSGRCVLWKGRGSDVAEVSCARLVGMDLTLTGELAEHDDGSEPASFWAMFGADGGRPQSADHWRLKPQYDKYSARLFCSDADARPPVYELHPFGQADLSPARIYILDAFFEMYIVVGAQAKAQYASFRNALDFAQEYAIMAAGMEDRPFVPVSSVVLEGIPRDLKRVFRKWDDARCPTLTSKPAADQHGLRRAHSLRVVTLTQALQALSDA